MSVSATPKYLIFFYEISLYEYQDNERIKPLSLVAEEGENVSFECDSQGTTDWFFMDPVTKTLKNLPNNTRVVSSTLYIINVEKRNLGTYECKGQMRDYINGSQNKVIFFSRSSLVMGRCHSIIIIVHQNIDSIATTLFLCHVITLTTEWSSAISNN